MAVTTRRALLEAGVHFGHQTRRWNPKMRRFIFGERSGIYIVDLEKTLSGLEEAFAFVREVARRGDTVLFVGTKKQAQDVVAEHASRVGMPYVNTRWLGGMLTNFQTIFGRLQRLKELREMERSGAFDFLPKKEALKLRREKEKLDRNLSGIQDMERRPGAIFVIDTKKEEIAVTEANKLRIPVVAIVDTNCDPDEVDYVIPGNDDAIRSVTLVTSILADAVREGQELAGRDMVERAGGATFEPDEPVPTATPLDLPEEPEIEAEPTEPVAEPQAAAPGTTSPEAEPSEASEGSPNEVAHGEERAGAPSGGGSEGAPGRSAQSG
jgi:small subunit ribosomal protein S2